MCSGSAEAGVGIGVAEARLESGLPIDEVEARLVESAKRHHCEERNIAYWLLEVHDRGLYRERGFSSLGDYAETLIEIHPRKAQYLVFIASRLEKLPATAEAFDAGELTWTKAREIVRVATPETEETWLEKARELSCHDLRRLVQQSEGTETGGFATLTISLPVELLRVWHECYELAERLSGSELEKYQVLEPMMAEYMSACMPSEHDEGPSPHATEDEKTLTPEEHEAVLGRAGYCCTFTYCTMRKLLDVHHIELRSQGGGNGLSNLTTLCRIHHGLVHRGIVKVYRDASGELVFERPPLFTEKAKPEPKREDAPKAAVEVQAESGAEHDAGSEDWREETVAAIFDGPPAPKPPRPDKDYGDFLVAWANRKAKEKLEARAQRRRQVMNGKLRPDRRGGADEHVFAEPKADEHVFAGGE